MLLAIDIGNTHVVLGVFDGQRLLHHWRIGTHRQDTSDECAATLRSLFELAGLERGSVHHGIISCVVPPLLPIFERTCEKLLRRPALVVGPGIRTGMPIRVENPREVGADRIVNSLAAFSKFGGPGIVVDFGTATTYDAVSEKGEFLGGAIAPGLQVAGASLFTATARLPQVELLAPRAAIGKNTVEAIQSGIVFGAAAELEGMIDRMEKELGPATVVATGGLAPIVIEHTDAIDRYEPWLTLEGLRIVYERNAAADA